MLNEHCLSNDDLMIIARISTKPFPSLSHQLFSPHPSLTYSSVSTQGQTSRRMRCCDQINFSLQKDQIIPPSPIVGPVFFLKQDHLKCYNGNSSDLLPPLLINSFPAKNSSRSASTLVGTPGCKTLNTRVSLR